MSKKVLHIIIGLNVGGAELMLKRLVLHSQQKGEYQHEVVSLTDLGVVGKTLVDQGIPVYTLGMISVFKLPVIFFKLKKLIQQVRPDVVQTWMYHADFLGGLAAKQVGIDNIIWGIRTTDVTQGASRITVVLRGICAKLSYRIPKKIVCAAHVSKDLHIQVGYDASKMVVIPNGFELDKLVATEEDRMQLRQELGLSDIDIVIGSVGRFNEVKNQKLFVEVAALLVKDFPNLKFMMVGRDNDENNEVLMKWLQEDNLVKNFRLLGQRSDIPKCLKTMDIFCLHSKTEGFPNVLGEAMYQEKVCISLDVGDARSLLPSILIVNKGNKVNLMNKIQETLNFSLDQTQIIGAQLKGVIENNYSICRIVGRYHLLYNKVSRG